MNFIPQSMNWLLSVCDEISIHTKTESKLLEISIATWSYYNIQMGDQ